MTYSAVVRTNDQLFAAPTGRRRYYPNADAKERAGLLGRLHFHHFRHVVLEKILDAHLERGGRARAARARALHVQVDHAVAEILEDDVAAILGDRRPDPRLSSSLIWATTSSSSAAASEAWPCSATTGS